MSILNRIFGKKARKADEKKENSFTMPSQFRDPYVINERDLYTKEEMQIRQQAEEALRKADKLVEGMSLEERAKIAKDFWNYGKTDPKPDPDSKKLIIESHIEEDED